MTPRSRLKILFDHNTPGPLRRYLADHEVDTAGENGWDQLTNGELIQLAAQRGYGVLITADPNITHQQNAGQSGIGIVVLLSNRWPPVRNHADAIVRAVHAVEPGETLTVPISP